MVAKESTLQQFVGRGCYTRDEVSRRESGLLYLCKVVLRVAVENHAADGDWWDIAMEPHLGDIEWIETILCSLLRAS